MQRTSSLGTALVTTPPAKALNLLEDGNLN